MCDENVWNLKENAFEKYILVINLPPLYAQNNLHWHTPINFSFFASTYPAFHISLFFKHHESNESNQTFEKNFLGSLIIMTAAVIAVTWNCTVILWRGLKLHLCFTLCDVHAGITWCWKYFS